MSTMKHEVESIGRIAPLNMPSETNRLNCDSLIHDMAAADDNDCNEGTSACQISWACAAVRG